MKMRPVIDVLLAVCCAFSCCPLPCLAQRQAKNNEQRTVAETIDSWIANAEREIVPAADAMPAERYGFAPSPSDGEFAGVRTFAQQVKHLAANNYWMAAMIRQTEYTPDMSSERGPDSVTTKPQLMRYLAGSFAALHAAAATITEANAAQPIRTPIGWQHTRLSLDIDAVAHSYDHYGQIVEYLRMNGIVPPASRPAAR